MLLDALDGYGVISNSIAHQSNKTCRAIQMKHEHVRTKTLNCYRPSTLSAFVSKAMATGWTSRSGKGFCGQAEVPSRSLVK